MSGARESRGGTEGGRRGEVCGRRERGGRFQSGSSGGTARTGGRIGSGGSRGRLKRGGSNGWSKTGRRGGSKERAGGGEEGSNL